jgi:hypothetical protein
MTTFDRSLFIYFFKHISFIFYNIIHNDDLYRKSLRDRARPPLLSLPLANGLVVFSFHRPIKTEINKTGKSFVNIIYPYLCIIIIISVVWPYIYILLYVLKITSYGIYGTISIVYCPLRTAALYIHVDCIISTI